MSVHRGFMSRGVSSQSGHGHRCQSTEGSCEQVSVQRVFVSTDVSPQSVHGYRCQSREVSWVQV